MNRGSCSTADGPVNRVARSLPPHMQTALCTLLAVVALLCTGCSSIGPTRLQERPDFARHFSEAGAVGTFVLFDAGENRYLVHNVGRARQRFIPASTFKVLNSLVALETRVVADTLESFEWDGLVRSVPQWNRDQTLATAFENSVVWTYQRIAREIGEERMRDYVRRAAYGNESIEGGIDKFWLTGDLRVSPMEQVDFLRRLHERRLPFSERTVDLVEGIMVESRGPGYVLRGKSGLAEAADTDVGWYVGYVVHSAAGGGGTYYFALEIDVTSPNHVAARRSIAYAILGDLGLL